MCLFYYCLDLAIANSLILQRLSKSGSPDAPQLDFRLRLIRELIKEVEGAEKAGAAAAAAGAGVGVGDSASHGEGGLAAAKRRWWSGAANLPALHHPKLQWLPSVTDVL